MDWQRVKAVICEGRRFAASDGGYSVVSDAILPSGAPIRVFMQARGDQLFLHDGGAAFDELARHGGQLSSVTRVRNMLKQTHFRLTDDGLIWRDHVPVEKVAVAIALVSDASVRAAHFMLDQAVMAAAPPLDRRLKDALRVRFPQGRPNFAIEGRHRQHTFDFGVTVGEKTVVIEAVRPDNNSIATAVLKGIDAVQAEGSNVVPLFVYDPRDQWTSGALGMLELGGRGVSIDVLPSGNLPIAA